MDGGFLGGRERNAQARESGRFGAQNYGNEAARLKYSDGSSLIAGGSSGSQVFFTFRARELPGEQILDILWSRKRLYMKHLLSKCSRDILAKLRRMELGDTAVGSSIRRGGPKYCYGEAGK